MWPRRLSKKKKKKSSLSDERPDSGAPESGTPSRTTDPEPLLAPRLVRKPAVTRTTPAPKTPARTAPVLAAPFDPESIFEPRPERPIPRPVRRKPKKKRLDLRKPPELPALPTSDDALPTLSLPPVADPPRRRKKEPIEPPRKKKEKEKEKEDDRPRLTRPLPRLSDSEDEGPFRLGPPRLRIPTEESEESSDDVPRIWQPRRALVRTRPLPSDRRAQSPTGRSADLAKTKRLWTDDARYDLNEARDKKFFTDLYRAWYPRGKRVAEKLDRDRDPDRNRFQKVYSLMGTGEAGYLTHAIDPADVAEFLDAGDGSYTMESQNQPRKAINEVLKTGDYFYVINREYDAPSYAGRSRRFIINLNSQAAGLRVAKALAPLFSDKTVGPMFNQFKVYLSSTADPTQPVKNDKIVLYYALAADNVDGTDIIGDRIAAAITGAIGPGDENMNVSPFYSRLTPAIAWAEDAEDYMSQFKGRSFTESRAELIAQVIKENPTMSSPEELMAKALAAFEAANVPSERPHRHRVPPRLPTKTTTTSFSSPFVSTPFVSTPFVSTPFDPSK